MGKLVSREMAGARVFRWGFGGQFIFVVPPWFDDCVDLGRHRERRSAKSPPDGRALIERPSRAPINASAPSPSGSASS
jgi:hypothetical protein